MTKYRPVLVALIAAAAVIIAAIINAAGGFLGSTSDYKGEIRDTSEKSVADANVRIFEDQKVPQSVTTDSAGIFHVNLLKKSADIYIEVDAEGYQQFARNVQSKRTGLEHITLNSISPPLDASGTRTRGSDIKLDDREEIWRVVQAWSAVFPSEDIEKLKGFYTDRLARYYGYPNVSVADVLNDKTAFWKK